MACDLLLSKQSQDGRQIEIKADGLCVRAYVAGQPSGTGLIKIAPRVIAGQTYVAMAGKVGLTQAEYDTIRAAHNNYIDSQPAVEAPKDLRSQRQSLLDEIRGCEDEADSRYWREHSKGDSDQGWHARRGWDEQAADARRRLAEFDAAHPEIIDAIKAEGKADAERFLRYD